MPKWRVTQIHTLHDVFECEAASAEIKADFTRDRVKF